MTTIDKVYCSPKTDEEWMSLLGYIPSDSCTRCVYYEDFGMLEIDSENEDLVNFDGMSEIEVSKFLDLAHDRITPWRLRELDFKMTPSYSMVNGEKQWMYWKGTLTVTTDYASAGGGSPLYLKTFTDLLTLIKFLTPLTK